MTAATITPWSTRCSRISISPRWSSERDRLRASGLLAGIGIAACLEPIGANSSFEPLLNEKNTTTTWMDSCRIVVDALGFVTVTIHNTSSGQGHETLVSTVVGEVLEIDPDLIRVIRPDSLACLPSQFAGRQPHGDHARRRGVPCRAEAEDKADADRRASVWRCRRQGSSTPTAASTAGDKQLELDRTRHHRPSPISICCPRAWSPASRARM